MNTVWTANKSWRPRDTFEFTLSNSECPYYYEKWYCAHVSNEGNDCCEEDCVFIKNGCGADKEE